MAVIHGENILLQDMYVNNTPHDSNGARNTDGLDTMFSNNLHINRWTVVNGDDSISTKANTTNILITNCTFQDGLGISLGSIGQYKDEVEILENITARDIIAYSTLHAAYVKTWTGEQVGYPTNGGGGGLGCTLPSLPSLFSQTNTHPRRRQKHLVHQLRRLQHARHSLLHLAVHNLLRGSRQLQLL